MMSQNSCKSLKIKTKWERLMKIGTINAFDTMMNNEQQHVSSCIVDWWKNLECWYNYLVTEDRRVRRAINQASLIIAEN